MTNDEPDANFTKLVENTIRSREGILDIGTFKPLRDLTKETSKDSKEPYTDEIREGKGCRELRQNQNFGKRLRGGKYDSARSYFSLTVVASSGTMFPARGPDGGVHCWHVFTDSSTFT